MYLPLFLEVLFLSLLRYALLCVRSRFACVHSSFAITLKMKRKLVALLIWSYKRFITINVMRLFLTVPWVGMQDVIVEFPDHIIYTIIATNLQRKFQL